MPPRSIWRDPAAQHFQVVHRSQRDPLIHDPEAGDRVLKQVERGNVAKGKAREAIAKGKSRADLEAELPAIGKSRANVGEAAEYGIYFDDFEYDYMQHLRPVGAGGNLPSHASMGGKDEEDDAEAILLEAPKQRNLQKNQQQSFQLKDDEVAGSSSKVQLPASVLPSEKELPRDYSSHLAVESSIAGLQPDMNPHLRQTLEALEDDAFVDEELEDDFFGDIITGGAGEGEGEDAEWMDLPPEGEEALWRTQAGQVLERAQQGEEIDEEELSLEERIALFKMRSKMEASMRKQPQKSLQAADDAASEVTSRAGPSKKPARPASSIGGSSSIFGDKKKKAEPGVKARYAASEAGQSAFSMSSSAMFRNKGLSGLDEHFEQIERLYGKPISEEDEFDDEEDFDDEDEEEEYAQSLADADVAIGEDGEPISRKDFDSIMDEFLNDYEVFGGKVRPSLGGTHATPAEKLDLVRKALGEARFRDDDGEESDEEAGMPEVRIIGSNREKWDVQTILSTKTNLENHPRTIAADSISIAPSSRADGSAFSRANYISSAVGSGTAEKVPKIKVDPRTGIPKIVGYTTVKPKKDLVEKSEERLSGDELENDVDASDADSDATEGPLATTITRPKNESAEDKKARKAAVKEAKAARRAEKSMTQQAFANEKKKQKKEMQARVREGGAADVGRNGIAAGVMRL